MGIAYVSALQDARAARPQSAEQSRNRAFTGAGAAIQYFYRDAKALLGDNGDENAFGARFDHRAACWLASIQCKRGPHRHQIRILRHRAAQS